MMTKSEIRKNIINQRNAQSPNELKENSRIICERLRGLSQYRDAAIIFSYMDAKNEVETNGLLAESIDSGKTVCLPVAYKNNSNMEFYKVNNLKNDLHVGNFGIQEPILKEENNIAFHNAELIIVPGVAFDLKLNRIGYGKGYYDRFLCQISANVPKIALAFDFQVLDSIPAEEDDVKLDMIITEKRIIERKR